MVSIPGYEIRTNVKVVGQNPSNDSIEKFSAQDPKSVPYEKKKGKKVAFDGLPFEQEEDQGKDDTDDYDDNKMGINLGDDYVSHATRTLTASKYAANATEYSIIVANAFFRMCD